MKKWLNILIMMMMPWPVQAQEIKVIIHHVDEAIAIAMENNAGLQAVALENERRQRLQKTASMVGKTYVYYSFDENNIALNGNALRVYGLQQSIPFPSVWSGRRQLYQINTAMAETDYNLRERDLKRAVSQAYYEILYLRNKLRQLNELDSLYADFKRAADKRYQVGESGYLEKITADNYCRQIHVKRLQGEEALHAALEKMRSLLQTEQTPEMAFASLDKIANHGAAGYRAANHPVLTYFNLRVKEAQASLRLQRQTFLPEVTLEYFKGFGMGENARNYDGYTMGLSIPLWFNPIHQTLQAERLQVEKAQKQEQQYKIQWEARQAQLLATLSKYETAINYFTENGLPSAREIQEVARRSYLAGEINYLNYIESLENAANTHLNYLDNLNHYNQTYLELYYLTTFN